MFFCRICILTKKTEHYLIQGKKNSWRDNGSNTEGNVAWRHYSSLEENYT